MCLLNCWFFLYNLFSCSLLQLGTITITLIAAVIQIKYSIALTTSRARFFLLPQGDYIWIEPISGREFDVAIGARVISAEGRRIQVKDDDGTEQWLAAERRIKAMHTSSVQGVEDMISLGDLHEAGILRNLLIRYNDNLIYVSETIAIKV